MKAWIACFLMFICAAGNAFATNLQLPIQIGEAESSVRQKLGEPDQVADLRSRHLLRYPKQGFAITIGAQSLVEAISVMHANEFDVVSYSGKIISDIDVNQTIDQVIKKLGASYTTSDNDESKTYIWTLGDIVLRVEAWEADYTAGGVTYPNRSIRTVEILKK
jgi:hypothetical protein